MMKNRQAEIVKIVILLLVACIALFFVDPGMQASPYNEF